MYGIHSGRYISVCFAHDNFVYGINQFTFNFSNFLFKKKTVKVTDLANNSYAASNTQYSEENVFVYILFNCYLRFFIYKKIKRFKIRNI